MTAILKPSVYTFAESFEPAATVCFDEYGLAGVHFSRLDPDFITQPTKVAGVWSWRQMNEVPDGINNTGVSNIAVDSTCADVTLDIAITGLLETWDPTTNGWGPFDTLEVKVDNVAQTFPSVYHHNNNCPGTTETILNENIIGSIEWPDDCVKSGADDSGDSIEANLSLTIYQSVCPTVISFHTDTGDAANNCGGNIFYEITVNIS